MAGAKIIVLYPYPTDVEEFERVYTEKHLPMINAETMPGLTRFIGTKIVGTADGSPPQFYRMAELHFSSIEAIQALAESERGQQTVAHAGSISSGGQPLYMVAQEEIIDF